MSVESRLRTRALQRAKLEWVWPPWARGVGSSEGGQSRPAAVWMWEAWWPSPPLHWLTPSSLLSLYKCWPTSSYGLWTLCVPGTNWEWPLIPNSHMVGATQCPSADARINKPHVSTQWNVTNLTKEGNLDKRFDMGAPWGHYAKWSKPVMKGQILCDPTSVRSLEFSNA